MINSRIIKYYGFYPFFYRDRLSKLEEQTNLNQKWKLHELKDYAKSIGLSFGNIGKEKLIEKIKTKNSEDSVIKTVMDDTDLDELPETENIVKTNRMNQFLYHY